MTLFHPESADECAGRITTPPINKPPSPPGQGNPVHIPATPASETQDHVAPVFGSDKGPVDGWPLVAKIMATKCELEAFPRFRELNAKNLLYYQVELDDLNGKLQRQEWEDWQIATRSRDSEANYAKYADKMIKTGRSMTEDAKACKQWDLVLEMRKLLQEYNAALLQHAQVSALPEPSRSYVNFLKSWISHPVGGNFCIGGAGSEVWGSQDSEKNMLAKYAKPNLLRFFWRNICAVLMRNRPSRTVSDLVTAQPHRKVDRLTRWVKEELIPYFDYHRGRFRNKSFDEENPFPKEMALMYQLSKEPQPYDRFWLDFIITVSTVIGCLLPTVAIAILTTAEDTKEKLLYIAGFTAVFAIGLLYAAVDASRIQIFTATIAFSAVLVVFVQGA